jgi:sugar lactone lactonase YvrE
MSHIVKVAIKALLGSFVILAAFFPQPAGAQTYPLPYTFTTLAGQPGVSGTNDGPGNSAQFNSPNGIAMDGSGILYITDFFNKSLRRVTPDGTVTTLITNLPALTLGLAIDSQTNLYISSMSDNRIRKIAPTGTSWTITVVAGTGNPGSQDGAGTSATFNSPNGIAVDNATNIYVADESNHNIRKIAPNGTGWIVSTLAGQALVSGTVDGTNKAARFFQPTGLAVDGAGNVYVADNGNALIRKITPVGTNWVVTTIAGTARTLGFSDGTGGAALFNQPNALAFDAATNLYVTDQRNCTIRKLTPSGTNWVSTTLAGHPPNNGTNDGTGSAALFSYPAALVIDGATNLYVTDAHTIRKGSLWQPNPIILNSANFGIQNSQFGFTVFWATNHDVVVETATDLANPAWVPVSTNSLTNGFFYFSDPSWNDYEARFYRLTAPEP